MYLAKRMKRRRAGLSGLSSRPYGPNVSKSALGTIVEVLIPTMTILDDPKDAPKPPPKPPSKISKARSYPMTVNGPALQGPPDWYRAMAGASLGDDTPTSGAVELTDGTVRWQQAMLSTNQAILAAQQEFTKREQMARYVQIAATLSIPLAAAVWRLIFRGGRNDGY